MQSQFFCVCVSCVSHAFTSVHCCLVVTCWERAYLLTLVGDVYCIFVTFPCGILGQVWYLIVSFPDLCHLSYFYHNMHVYYKVLKSYGTQCLLTVKQSKNIVTLWQDQTTIYKPSTVLGSKLRALTAAASNLMYWPRSKVDKLYWPKLLSSDNSWNK